MLPGNGKSQQWAAFQTRLCLLNKPFWTVGISSFQISEISRNEKTCADYWRLKKNTNVESPESNSNSVI